MNCASWGPILWPFRRSPARAPTIKALRETVAIYGIFDNKRTLGSCYGGGSVPLTGASVPLTGGGPFPLQTSFNCLIVGLGPGAFNRQGFGVSLGI